MGPFFYFANPPRFPAQSGRPVLVSREQFEECCCAQYYVYLAGGIAIDGSHFYPVPLPPELLGIVSRPPFVADYADRLSGFGPLVYSSIEILVYKSGAMGVGVKVAYGNRFENGPGATSISLPALGCFDSDPGLSWNYGCDDL